MAKGSTKKSEKAANKQDQKAVSNDSSGVVAKANPNVSQASTCDLFSELSDNFRFAELFPRLKDENRSLSALRADLQDVPVLSDQGKVTNVYNKIESSTNLRRQDKDLVWHCLAIVREAYLRLEAKDKKSNHGGGYQWNMNWKHTRAELDQVCEASRILGLDPAETRDALIASIFSDSVKNRENFIIHNIHGAQAAALVLSYFLDSTKEEDRQSTNRIVLAIKQHQIAPPEFMARTVAILLCRRYELEPFHRLASHGNSIELAKNPLNRRVISIYSKIRMPYEKEHLSADLGLIDFTKDERTMLKELGIEDWYVPHPEIASSAIAHALIAGDHSINYNNPDGFAKIALIRGPSTEVYFEDATIYDSLESAMASFGDSFAILLPDVRPLALAGIRRTHRAVTRVLRVMTELFANITVGPKELSCTVSGSELVAQALERAKAKNPEIFQADAVFSSEAGHKYLERAIERVGNIISEWRKEYGDIPFSAREAIQSEPGPGRLPFWNTPLRYPLRDENGEQVMTSLSALEQTQFAFAVRIREIAVELLRAEQWFFS